MSLRAAQIFQSKARRMKDHVFVGRCWGSGVSQRSLRSSDKGRKPSHCQILLARGHVMKRWLEFLVVVAHRGHMSESMICLRARLTLVLRRSLKSNHANTFSFRGTLALHMRGARRSLSGRAMRAPYACLVVKPMPCRRNR